METIIFLIISVALIIIAFILKRIKVNQYSVLDENSKNIIDELMIKSHLPQNICTDVYLILIQFSHNNKKGAYTIIENNLIPDLKINNHIGDVGIAFGMLINKNALNEQEAVSYSTIVMNQLLPNK